MQINELKFHIVRGDSKLSPWTIWILSIVVLCRKAIWTGQLQEASHLHHCPECSRCPQLITTPQYRTMPITFPVAQSVLKLISWGLIKFPPIVTTLRRPQLPRLLVFMNFLACPLVWETAQTFKRFVDEILQDWDFCFSYLVDTFVISCSPYPLHQTSNRRYPTEPIQMRFTCSWNILGI